MITCAVDVSQTDSGRVSDNNTVLATVVVCYIKNVDVIVFTEVRFITV